MGFKDVENALVAWVRAASGFDAQHVFWTHQKVSRPADAYITLHFNSVLPRGAVDSVLTNYDAGRPAGSEIELKVIGRRALSVSVQVFKAPVTHATDLSALEIALKVQQGLRLPTINAALNDAGVPPFDLGTVNDLAVALGPRFEGRAAFDARFNTHITVSEFTTYISTVVMTESTTGDEYVIQEE